MPLYYPPNSTISQLTGWGDYADTQYTSASPLTLSADTDTVIPNNAGSTVASQVPSDVSAFYNSSTGKITGRNGDAIIMTFDLVAKPTQVGTDSLEVWVDIGGSVGELYRRIVTFPKGQNVNRPVTISTGAYTLDTWETNGATPYIRSNGGQCEIFDIRFVVFRLHKAR